VTLTSPTCSTFVLIVSRFAPESAPTFCTSSARSQDWPAMSTPPLAICVGRRALVWFEGEAEPKRSRRERGQRDARRKKQNAFYALFRLQRKEGSGGTEVKKKPAFSRPVANSPRFSRIALSDACRVRGKG
jgi:hypothetical protein